MSYLRLASGSGIKEVEALSRSYARRPSLLVSYIYLEAFNRVRDKLKYRDWVLDSGAYTAWRDGKKIHNKQFCEDVSAIAGNGCGRGLAEVFALDVIGDPQQSFRNAVQARDEYGLNVVPTWHAGEPQACLLEMAAEFEKIAIGGMAGTFEQTTPGAKRKIVDNVFGKVWPKLIHGFGVGGPDILLNYPFDSADASNWATGPQCWGQWAHYDQWAIKVPVPSKYINLIGEVKWYLELEEKSEVKFGELLKPLRCGRQPIKRQCFQERQETQRAKWEDYWRKRFAPAAQKQKEEAR